MKEAVGSCVNCGKTVFCENGFLAGAVADDKRLYCFSCLEEESDDQD
ncbi:hypothetical protein [Desertibacillus haloalkaliphilus]|nr:hypothetical protein [Desertibacillus haloalkaliphilus]MBU8908663.1 hypothetical protein [Desertibacillus haloalkaliphilus]